LANSCRSGSPPQEETTALKGAVKMPSPFSLIPPRTSAVTSIHKISVLLHRRVVTRVSHLHRLYALTRSIVIEDQFANANRPKHDASLRTGRNAFRFLIKVPTPVEQAM